jgi:Bacterial PH domain/Short C-terminal domain
MPFGFSEKNKLYFKTDLTSKDELEEISKIINLLNSDEKVLLVAKQSRIKPGGSNLTPNVVFATDKRIIIRDPYMLGMRENIVDIPYDIITSVKLEKGILSSTIVFRAPGLINPTRLGLIDKSIGGSHPEDGAIETIPKDKAEKLIEIIRQGMKNSKNINQQIPVYIENKLTSIADELMKLAKLKEQGILSEEEFLQMKQDLLKKAAS